LDQQIGRLFLGAESDIKIGGASGEGPVVFFDAREGEFFPGDPLELGSFDTIWQGSTRVRFGVALARLMPYVTGGLA
jgi:hypothetical protein